MNYATRSPNTVNGEPLPAIVQNAILRRHIYALRRLLLNESVPDRHAREAAAQRLTALYQLDPVPESQRRLSDE
jgi:hypothetical protein